MTLRDWLLKFVEDNWTVVLLLGLFGFLMFAHGFEIHFNRPASVISWNENMVSAVFAAIIAKLK